LKAHEKSEVGGLGECAQESDSWTSSQDLGESPRRLRRVKGNSWGDKRLRRKGMWLLIKGVDFKCRGIGKRNLLSTVTG